MRIITRPDFDGIVCAVLLREALGITGPVFWAEPSDVQKGRISLQPGDILANLPFHPEATMWFDHHYSNRVDQPFSGAFEIAPSAAGVIHRYYADRLTRDYTELVAATDRIDAAQLTLDEVKYPERYPTLLLSMTITGQDEHGPAYWEEVVDLLGRQPVDAVMKSPQVQRRCAQAVEDNRAYRDVLLAHTTVTDGVAVTDLRGFNPAPTGNRFLVYALFPECRVQARIRYDGKRQDRVVVSVGHSIFNRTCEVNVGLLLKGFGGGGHRGAGACTFPLSWEKECVPDIIEALRENKKND